MDFYKAIDILTPSVTGKRWTPLHPKTGKPFLVDESTPFSITFMGTYAPLVKQAAKLAGDERASVTGRGGVITDDMRDRENARFVARCAVSWTLAKDADGNDLAFSEDAVFALFVDPKFSWMTGLAMAFIQDDAGFLPA